MADSDVNNDQSDEMETNYSQIGQQKELPSTNNEPGESRTERGDETMSEGIPVESEEAESEASEGGDMSPTMLTDMNRPPGQEGPEDQDMDNNEQDRDMDTNELNDLENPENNVITIPEEAEMLQDEESSANPNQRSLRKRGTNPDYKALATGRADSKERKKTKKAKKDNTTKEDINTKKDTTKGPRNTEKEPGGNRKGTRRKPRAGRKNFHLGKRTNGKEYWARRKSSYQYKDFWARRKSSYQEKQRKGKQQKTRRKKEPHPRTTRPKTQHIQCNGYGTKTGGAGNGN